MTEGLRSVLRQVRVYAVAAALAATVLVAPTVMGPADATLITPALRQRTAVPAYWPPDTPAGRAMFSRLAQQYPANDLVVVNPYNGPATAYSGAYAQTIRTLHAAGALALGYVDTGYFGIASGSQSAQATRLDGPGGGATSIAAWTAQILHDIDAWHRFYGDAGLAGIFLDQTSAVCGTAADPDRDVDLYAVVNEHIGRHYPDDTIVINPGMPVPQCYADVADTIVTFEGTAAAYLDPANPIAQPTAWQLNSTDPGKFWHLVYDAATSDEMTRVVEASKRRNAGYIYVTDDRLTTVSGVVVDHPWDTLPAYWNAELAAAAANADTTPPAPPHCLSWTAVADAGGVQATVRWMEAYDDTAVGGYEVRRDGGSPTGTVDTELTLTGLQPATRYRFQVRSRDVAGNVSAWSGPLVVRTPPVAG